MLGRVLASKEVPDYLTIDLLSFVQVALELGGEANSPDFGV